MIVVNGEIEKAFVENDKNYVKCQLLADEKPVVLPTTGADIKGLTAENYLAAGTVLMTKAFEIVILGEEGWGNWQ